MTSTSLTAARSVPRVLFVSHDCSSAEVAAQLLRRVVGPRVTVDTAGTQAGDPGGRSDEMLVAMGLDPVGEHRLSAVALRTADHVILLDAGLDVARLPGPRYEEWDLAEDDLGERVQALSDALTVPAVVPAGVQDRLRRLLHRRRR